MKQLPPLAITILFVAWFVVFPIDPAWAVDLELANINKIEQLSKTGKTVICTYKGVKHKIIGIAKGIIGHAIVAGRVGNSPVFISRGESPFFNVRADQISNIEIDK